jgi:transcriptional regulator with XRE-family HTH domain
MEKSKFTEEYELLITLLRDVRKRSGTTQTEIADRLGWTQSAVSKCERGERRLDAIELRRWVLELGLSFSDFLQEYEGILGTSQPVVSHPDRPRKK